MTNRLAATLTSSAEWYRSQAGRRAATAATASNTRPLRRTEWHPLRAVTSPGRPPSGGVWVPDSSPGPVHDAARRRDRADLGPEERGVAWGADPPADRERAREHEVAEAPFGV